MAADLAVVDYVMENLEPPILSVEEAVRKVFLRFLLSFNQNKLGISRKEWLKLITRFSQLKYFSFTSTDSNLFHSC